MALEINKMFDRADSKKPFISEANCLKRVAQEYRNKTISYWNNVIFSYESMEGDMFGTKKTRRMCLCIYKPQLNMVVYLSMAWGCMASNGTGKLCFTENTTTACNLYQQPTQ